MMEPEVADGDVSACSSFVTKNTINAEKLVELVRGFPHLYNTSLVDYKDQIKKSNSWRNIAQTIGEGYSPTECQKRFKGLKDTYLKERKRLRTLKSGASGKHKKLWTYYYTMDSLLGEFQDLVETHGNIEVCFEEPKDDTSSGTTGNELPCSNILAVPYPPKKRIQEFDILEDALLKSINATNEDSLFAQSVGQTLQRLGNAQKALAKMKIMQILFEAEASSPAE